MDAPTHLQDGPLLLRLPELSDDDALFKHLTSHEATARYLTWRPHTSVAETRRILTTMREKWEGGVADHTWVIDLAPHGACGLISAWPGEHGVELGYALAPARWGEGWMTCAVQLVTDATLAQEGVFRVWATCDVDNPASARVLERCGFRHEGRLARWAVHPNLGEEPRDNDIYARCR